MIFFAAALSNLEIIVEKNSFASLPFLVVIRERNFFIELFRSLLNFRLCRCFVLSTRSLFIAVLLCGNFNVSFLNERLTYGVRRYVEGHKSIAPYALRRSANSVPHGVI